MVLIDSFNNRQRTILMYVVCWIFYGLMVWVYNSIFRSETGLIQTLAGLPPLVLAFLVGQLLVHVGLVKRRYFLASLITLVASPCLVVFGYLWIYYWTPMFQVHVFYSRPPNEFELYLEISSSLLLQFLIYGMGFSLLQNPKLVRTLRSKVLALQISPHHLREVWSRLLLYIPHNNHIEQAHMKSEVQLYEYAAQIPSFSGGVVTLEREMIELESLITHYADRHIIFQEFGRPNGQRILPGSLIELLRNALKYADKQYPIQIQVDYRDGVNFIIQNRIKRESQIEHGLGTGLINLRERLYLIFGDKATLETTISGDIFLARLNFK